MVRAGELVGMEMRVEKFEMAHARGEWKGSAGRKRHKIGHCVFPPQAIQCIEIQVLAVMMSLPICTLHYMYLPTSSPGHWT